MSDSEAPLPSSVEIRQCLHRTTRDARKHDPDTTINKIRSLAEAALDLKPGFFKDHAEWKSKSKDIISAAFEEPASPVRQSEPVAESTTGAGTKRKSKEPLQVKKKRRKAVADSDDDTSDDDAEEGGETNLDQEEEREEEEEIVSKNQNGKSKPADLDDSDLSSLIDEPPKKQRRKKTAATKEKTKAISKSSKSSKPKPVAKDLSPDEEEVKRLQGWLLKCGIRKLWHRELAHCSTPKEKMNHLKGMLDDVGMTGRYSAEKAKQIKASRELAAELDAAQEFNDRWGLDGGRRRKKQESSNGNDDEEDDKEEDEEIEQAPKPRRAVPNGKIDFGDSEDDEE